MTTEQQLTLADYKTAESSWWCPGCGDFGVLAALQRTLLELAVPPEQVAIVAGIGCSGKIGNYINSYNVHVTHGRTMPASLGVKLANRELTVIAAGGDGDGYAIGMGHFIHAIRRNPDITYIVMDNQIYGLTKGQYSPTSEEGKVTKSTPFGSVDHPFNPIALALGAEASFVARTIDNDRKHLTEVLRQAAAHRGTSFVEIYQNCNVFNDGAFDLLREKPQGAHNQIRLVHGEPILFDEGTRCVAVGDNGRLVVKAVDEVSPDAIVVHDVKGRPSLPFALAHVSRGPGEPTCIGVFRAIDRSVYGDAMEEQMQGAIERQGAGDLGALLTSGDTWTVN